MPNWTVGLAHGSCLMASWPQLMAWSSFGHGPTPTVALRVIQFEAVIFKFRADQHDTLTRFGSRHQGFNTNTKTSHLLRESDVDMMKNHLLIILYGVLLVVQGRELSYFRTRGLSKGGTKGGKSKGKGFWSSKGTKPPRHHKMSMRPIETKAPSPRGMSSSSGSLFYRGVPRTTAPDTNPTVQRTGDKNTNDEKNKNALENKKADRMHVDSDAYSLIFRMKGYMSHHKNGTHKPSRRMSKPPRKSKAPKGKGSSKSKGGSKWGAKGSKRLL